MIENLEKALLGQINLKIVLVTVNDKTKLDNSNFENSFNDNVFTEALAQNSQKRIECFLDLVDCIQKENKDDFVLLVTQEGFVSNFFESSSTLFFPIDKKTREDFIRSLQKKASDNILIDINLIYRSPFKKEKIEKYLSKLSDFIRLEKDIKDTKISFYIPPNHSLKDSESKGFIYPRGTDEESPFYRKPFSDLMIPKFGASIKNFQFNEKEKNNDKIDNALEFINITKEILSQIVLNWNTQELLKCDYDDKNKILKKEKHVICEEFLKINEKINEDFLKINSECSKENLLKIIQDNSIELMNYWEKYQDKIKNEIIDFEYVIHNRSDVISSSGIVLSYKKKKMYNELAYPLRTFYKKSFYLPGISEAWSNSEKRKKTEISDFLTDLFYKKICFDISTYSPKKEYLFHILQSDTISANTIINAIRKETKTCFFIHADPKLGGEVFYCEKGNLTEVKNESFTNEYFKWRTFELKEFLSKGLIKDFILKHIIKDYVEKNIIKKIEKKEPAFHLPLWMGLKTHKKIHTFLGRNIFLDEEKFKKLKKE